MIPIGLRPLDSLLLSNQVYFGLESTIRKFQLNKEDLSDASDDDVIVSSGDQKVFISKLTRASNHENQAAKRSDKDDLKSAFISTKKDSAKFLNSASNSGIFTSSKSASENKLFQPIHSSSAEMQRPFITSAFAENYSSQTDGKSSSQFLPNQATSAQNVNAFIQQVSQI